MRDVHGIARSERDLLIVTRDDGSSRDGEPVLATPLVALEAQALAGIHNDALDLVVGFIR